MIRNQYNRMLNVIVFGETGAGKSSVINMLDGGKDARVSDQASGMTFCNTSYEKKITGSTFRVFDTAGLNEGHRGLIPARDAIEGLYNLIQQLDDGISLLVYVMRAPRLKITAQQNYEMFHNIFCRRMVPIVIVVTGLEERENMEKWWEENEEVFARFSMRFCGYACITATKGKFKDGTHLYEEEYRLSREKVQTLILRSHSPNPWSMPRENWLETVVRHLHNVIAPFLGLDHIDAARELQVALSTFARPKNDDAIRHADKAVKQEENRTKTKGSRKRRFTPRRR